MLASIRQPNFVTFTVGNLSLGDVFFFLTLFFHEPSWSWSGSWIKALLKILLSAPVKYELLLNIWGWIKNFSLDHWKHLQNSISQVFSLCLVILRLYLVFPSRIQWQGYKRALPLILKLWCYSWIQNKMWKRDYR